MFRLLIIASLLALSSCGRGGRDSRDKGPGYFGIGAGQARPGASENSSVAAGASGLDGVGEPRDVIARVDDRTMTTDDLKVIDPTGTMTADEIGIAVDDWIDQEVLLKIANTRGLDRDTAVRWRLEEARAEIVLPRLGKLLAAGTGGETAAKVWLRHEVEATKKSSRIERYPWKAQ